MMLQHLDWDDAAARVNTGLAGAIAAKTVTYDLARQMDGAHEVKCSEFAAAIVEKM